MNGVNFLKTEEVFAVSGRCKLTKELLGSDRREVLIVDNFYKSPEKVRDFFLTAPAPNWKMSGKSKNFKDYYDARQSFYFRFGFDPVTDAISDLIQRHLGVRVAYPPMAHSNIFQLIKDQPGKTTAFPHADNHYEPSKNLPFNTLVFLNTNREAKGGTAFYRHKETGRDSMPLEKKAYIEFQKKYIHIPGVVEDGSTYWCKYEKHWDKIQQIDMRFNRLVVFPSEIFHGAWHEPGWFKKYPRLSQVFFSNFL